MITQIGSYEARENGRIKAISAPVIVVNGIIYVPISIFSEVMGELVTNLGNGVYAIGNANAEAVNAALKYIG